MKPSNPWSIGGEVGRCLTARAATPAGLSRFASSCQHRIAIADELAEATVDEVTQAVQAAIAAGWTVIAGIIWLVVIGYALKLAVVE